MQNWTNVFRAVTYALVGLLSVTLLILSLISASREQRFHDRLNGLVFFTLAIIGLCTAAVAFLAGTRP
jgi:hypothetical protein